MTTWTSDELTDPDVNDEVDSAYRTKYGHYAAHIIQAITSFGHHEL
jgi:hypothetical protein